MKLKPLTQQVVVVLGASSGIGRETALLLGRRGAKVLVAARTEDELQTLVDEITDDGGQASYVVCDVVELSQVQAVADAAVSRYGRIDTWVTVAGMVIHAAFEDTRPEDFRRVMEVNYLGQVHGALAALPHLRESGGGAIIAVSSAEGVVAMPGHSAYSASKHAIEGLISGLRRDLRAQSLPISVTSIKPSGTNTPVFGDDPPGPYAKPTAPPPIYPMSVVADSVAYAAEHPVREIWAGGSGLAAAVGQALAPRLMDAVIVRLLPLPKSGGDAAGDDDVDSALQNGTRKYSVTTWLQLHPWAGAAVVGAVATGLTSALALRRKRG